MTERIGFWVDLDERLRHLRPRVRRVVLVGHEGASALAGCSPRTTRSRGTRRPRTPPSRRTGRSRLGYRKDVPGPQHLPGLPGRRRRPRRPRPAGGGATRDVAFLAWTTTPWTLAANTGLAVLPDATYALVRGARAQGRASMARPVRYVLAEALLARGLRWRPARGPRHVPWQRPGGARYRPLLRGRPDDADAPDLVGWRVVADDFGHARRRHRDRAPGPRLRRPRGRSRNGLPTRWSVDLTGQVLPEVALEGAPEGPGSLRRDLVQRRRRSDHLRTSSQRARTQPPRHHPAHVPVQLARRPAADVRRGRAGTSARAALKERLVATNDQIRW